MRVQVICGGQVRESTFSAPTLLSELIEQCGMAPDKPCGGRGRCGKCTVQVTGAMQPPAPAEQRVLTAQQLQNGFRLACCAIAQGDVVITLPEKTGEQITTDAVLPDYTLTPGEGLGFAVDIGTTTLAAYFYDRATGELLGTESAPNPQANFGADVISRMEKALAGQQAALAQTIRQGVGQLLLRFCAENTHTPTEFTAGVLTGNTAMLYLLCEQDVTPISRVPFTLTRPFGETVSAALLDLPCEGNVPVYLPRCFSSYVGADINTAVLSSGMVQSGKVAHDNWMLADIGTNGEIVLSRNGELVCCSTAAGPAFEGAGIYKGMRAQKGAICKVALQDGALTVETVGGAKAIGICGSGLVDAIAALLDAGVLDETGVLLEEDHAFLDCMTEVDDQPAFRFPGTDVVLTQKDIRSVQMAKSAVNAGMLALLNAMDMEKEQVERLIIAGGFGSNLNMHSAERIGLICAGFAEKTVCVGNAAGAGASLLLLDEEKRASSESLRANALELATDPVFMDAYIDGMYFA